MNRRFSDGLCWTNSTYGEGRIDSQLSVSFTRKTEFNRDVIHRETIPGDVKRNWIEDVSRVPTIGINYNINKCEDPLTYKEDGEEEDKKNINNNEQQQQQRQRRRRRRRRWRRTTTTTKRKRTIRTKKENKRNKNNEQQRRRRRRLRD